MIFIHVIKQLKNIKWQIMTLEIAVLEQSDSRKAEVQLYPKESAPWLSNKLRCKIRCCRSLCFLQPYGHYNNCIRGHDNLSTLLHYRRNLTKSGLFVVKPAKSIATIVIGQVAVAKNCKKSKANCFNLTRIFVILCCITLRVSCSPWDDRGSSGITFYKWFI